MPVRAVLFDVGDTLWHSAGAPPAEEFRRIAAARAATELARLGLAHGDPALVARTLWLGLERAMREARATDLREPNYHEVAREALESIGLGLPAAEAGAFLEATYISGPDGGKAPYPGARETLEELRRRGFLLATVTNRAFGGDRFRTDLRAAGLDIGWDAEAVSVEVGWLKPHPALFEHALAALGGLEAEQAVMVGNSLSEDIAGAQRLGMRAAWKRCAPDAEGVLADFTFEHITELLEWPLLRRAT